MDERSVAGAIEPAAWGRMSYQDLHLQSLVRQARDHGREAGGGPRARLGLRDINLGLIN